MSPDLFHFIWKNQCMSTLSLCVIVGANETAELRRLLESTRGELFDEILITCTQKDEEVRAVAEAYATKVSFFEWCNDFAAARNFNMQQASSDFVMWLDADDEIPSEAYARLVELKQGIAEYDCVYLTYNYSWDEKGNPYLVLPRERIMKVSAGPRWNDPIHEWLSLSGGSRRLDRPDICINHRRTRSYDSSRNLSILKKVYDEGKASPRLKFYYAKDLFDSGDRHLSLNLFNEYLVGEPDFNQNKAIACMRLAQHCQEIQDTPAAERFWNASISFCSEYAEPYYYLGKVAEGRGDLEKSLAYFREALTKDPQKVFAAQPPFYRMYPCSSIVFILSRLKRYEEAEFYNNKNMGWYPGNPDYLFNHKYLQGKKHEHLARAANSLRVGWQSPAPLSAVTGAFITEIPGLSLEQTAGYSASELARSFDILVITDLQEGTDQWVASLRREGVRVLVEVSCAGHEGNREVLRNADGIICRSEALLSELRQINACAFAWGGVPHTDTLWEYNYENMRRGPLRVAVSNTAEVALLNITGVGELVRVAEEDAPGLLACDAFICLHDTLSEALSQVIPIMEKGIPVVCPHILSEFLHDGRDALCYSSREDIPKILQKLTNPSFRIKLGVLGQDICRHGKLSKESQSAELLVSLKAVWDRSLRSNVLYPLTAPIPIVIPVYKNMDYLAVCLGSITQNTHTPHFVVLSDAGSSPADWDYLRSLSGYLTLGSPNLRKNFSQAVNDTHGLVSSSEYFVLLNSDVIVSHGWLGNLVKHMRSKEKLAACGVLSNCDLGWLHGREGYPSYAMDVPGTNMTLVPGMEYSEVIPHLHSLFDFMKTSNTSLRGVYREQTWVAYYATMFRTDSWNKTGGLDPAFVNGCEDLDHARRLRMLGYEIGQAIDSFVFHFGGISRAAYEVEDNESFREEDRRNQAIYKQKWLKKRIAIYTGPAWEKWNRESVDAGMAGSETWAAEIGAEFVKKGFAVTVFNDPVTDGEFDYNGVEYRDYRTFGWWQRFLHVDYVILSRTCDPLKHIHMHSRNVSVMVHDVTLLSDLVRETPSMDAPIRFGCLSEWHLAYFSKQYGLSPENTFLTANGVRGELYRGVNANQKRNRAVYSSSPDRGLLTLLQMLPRIREHVPDFELVVTYGFTNWKSCAEYYGRQKDLAKIRQIEELLKQPGVIFLGRVSKRELAELQKSAKVWLYPTWFTETWCISLVEQGFAGNAVVTTPLAGILTTGGDAPVYVRGPEGVPTEQWCNTPEYQDEFIKQAVLLLRYEDYRREVADRVTAQTKKYTWEAAAESWLREWQIIL